MPRTAASAPFPATAIVLRVRPLGEKDRVLTLLCPERGKLAAVAKGARGAKSKLAAVAQPFMLGRFLLAQGRTFAIINQAQIERAHGEISGDNFKTAWASYCCELCDSLPEALPDESAFVLLRETLGFLDEAAPDDSAQIELIGRWFEARFLALLGYSPTLGRCMACGVKISVPEDEMTTKIAFSPSMGGTLCASDAARDGNRLNLSVQSLRALHKLERTLTPTIAVVDLTKQARRDLKTVLRACLQTHLDLRLRSLKFLDQTTPE